MIEDEGYTQWSNAEVSCLLSLWGEETVQAKMQGCYRNKSVFEDISRDMGRHGLSAFFSAVRDQCFADFFFVDFSIYYGKQNTV